MKTVRKFGLLAVVAMAAVACGGSSPSAPATGSAIVLGAPLGLTGSLTKESDLTQQGYNLWHDWINARGGIVVNGVKHPVTIKYYDDTSNANQSAVLMQKLITEDKANFLLGPYGSAATATDAAIAEQNQIPMVEANGAAQSIFNQGYKYTFGVLSPANKYLQGVIDMAATLNPKPMTLFMLSADDNFSLEVANAIVSYAPTKGITVYPVKKYKNGATNLSAEVQAAKAATPDIVLNSGHLTEAIAINKAAKEQKLNAKIFAYSVGPSTPDFITALAKDADYVYGGSQWTPQVKYTPAFYLTVAQYVAAYKAKYPGRSRLPRRRVDGRVPGPAARDRERGVARSEEGARCAGGAGRDDVLRADQVRQPRDQHLQADGRRADPERRAPHRLSRQRRGREAAVPDPCLGFALILTSS